MNPPERLRQVIADHDARLRSGVPAGRGEAVLALVRVIDRSPHSPCLEPTPDLVTGHRLVNLGGNRALHLCLTASGGTASGAPAPAGHEWDRWAESFLLGCGQLTEAELVLAHCETGFMRMIEASDGTFDAWIATKRVPTGWRERADIDWWAAWLAGCHGSRQPRQFDGSDAPEGNTQYRQRAAARIDQMAYQLGYPPDAVIVGCTIKTCRDVLGWLIGRALYLRDRGEAALPQSEHELIAALSSALRSDPVVVAQTVAAFTLDSENAEYHAAAPGIAAPLVRVAPGELVLSLYGLMTNPLLFLTRELRRRDAEAYNNSAHLREGVFRADLYALFRDKRFVTSTGRIELRRDSGNIRTDIDAAIFDRKTGTLGLFELKTQDPFARSTAELTRQRDNVLYANRQVSGILAWLNRHGAADEILNRIDRGTAKTFRVHKVYPFVLGRYVVHFNDGPEPDRRAAWGTWPQVLRLLGGQPASGANPVASLFTQLVRDTPLINPPAGDPPKEIPIGGTRLTVYPTQASYQAGRGDRLP